MWKDQSSRRGFRRAANQRFGGGPFSADGPENGRQRLGKEFVENRLRHLIEQKEKLKPEIPAELLKKYQFLRANRAGVALAPVNRGTCQVCHMNLPPQLYIDLQRNEQMIHCPNCQRIIYWVGHPAYQLSSQILGEQD